MTMRSRAVKAACDGHAEGSKTTETPKFSHEMIWKCAETLDQADQPVSNHISVISRLAGRFRCRRPRFDHMFELSVHQNSGKHSLSQIKAEEADEACLMSTFGAL
jgi:hypothetical protein